MMMSFMIAATIMPSGRQAKSLDTRRQRTAAGRRRDAKPLIKIAREGRVVIADFSRADRAIASR